MPLVPSKPVAALVSCLMAVPAPAASARDGCDAPQPASFRIEHAVFGSIGRHELAFRCEGGKLLVETVQSIDVEVLGIGAYDRTARYREVWRGDRLVEFEGKTVEDGETHEVIAMRRGDWMVIKGPAGSVEVPPTVVPDNPWNRAVVERTLLFDVSSGEVLRVEVRTAGTATFDIEGRSIRARRYVRTGDREHELWYADGAWLRWRLERTTGDVTFVRESLPSAVRADDAP